MIYSNHCKISQSFEGLLVKLNTVFERENSSLIAISPNNENAIFPDELAYTDLGDSFEEMKIRSKTSNFKFPYLYDGEGQTIILQLKTKSTPHAYLFNENRDLIYSGKVGDLKNNMDLNASDLYLKYLNAKENKDHRPSFTKVYGTAIKTKEDVSLAQQIKQRYASEKVRLLPIDQKKLNFFLQFKTHKPSIFYLWSLDDANSRENLLKLSSIYKIFRKRGLKLYTLNVDKNTQKALWSLENAQLSSSNFYIDGMDITAIAKFLPSEARTLTPFMLLVGSDKRILYKTTEKIDSYICKRIIIKDLENKDLQLSPEQ